MHNKPTNKILGLSWKLPLSTFILTVLSVISAFLIGFLSYKASLRSTVEEYHSFYLREARMLVKTAELLGNINDDAILKNIETIWRSLGKKPSDEYLCIVNKSVHLIMHTADPETLGDYAGENKIFSDDPKGASTLIDLVKSKQDYVGDYTSSAGQAQIAAFSAMPSKNWVIGVHRSKKMLLNEVESNFRFFKYALIIICIVLLPLSLLLLYITFYLSQRQHIRDITALEESEKLNRCWLENSPVCTKIVDLDYNLQYMSTAGTEGIGIEDIKPYYGKPYPFDFYPESFRNKMTNNLEKARETGENITQEEPVVDLEGNELWFHSTIVPIKDEEDRIKYFLVVSIDTTSRNLAEKESVQLTTVIEQADETVVITDKEGKITYTNPAFERITGYTCEEAIGQNPSILKSGKQDDELYADLWSTVSAGNVWKGHFVNKKKDGTLYDEEVTISPVKNDAGETINYVAVKRDVTLELKLQDQLRQSQKMEAIGTLAGGIAHDFNNLLSVIVGYSELSLEDVKDRPGTQQSLSQVLNAAYRARDLVSQILTFSRSTNVEKKLIKTTPIVKEICNFIRSSLPATIELRQKLTAKNDWIMADATQFHQVLMNLCANAGYAMKEKGGELELTLEEVLLNEDDLIEYPDLKIGTYLKLTLSDTGSGIRKENMVRIFEPYYTTKKKGKGSGLGLSVVHGIVKDQGGNIKVYSEVGKGTTFHILLPLVEKAVGTDHTGSVEPFSTGTKKILLVDDEEFLVDVGKQMLEGLGHTVTGTMSCEEAIEIFKRSKESFDLVITDKTMPKMTGFDLAKEIRKIQPNIPILLCTGFDEKDIDHKLKEAGIGGYIMKPINKRVMAEGIWKVLNQKGS